ncbi:Na(+):H(+) antiporter NhaA [Hyphomicrobium sp. 1Nfss2.1]
MGQCTGAARSIRLNGTSARIRGSMARRTQSRPRKTIIQRVDGAKAFFQHEAAGGIVLLVAAIVGLLMQNSAASWLYDALLSTPVTVRIGALNLDKPLLLWINDGMMAVFFFLVGLEIKREMAVGELSSIKQASLPAIAAVGGMLVPALIYWAINRNDDIALHGWAIPTATDIAFAVGVLALLGPRVPLALKVFLLALAIIDDLGAIIVIAVFYTEHLTVEALALASVGVAALAVLNAKGVTRTAPYILVGLFIWVCVLKSGVHATLAGVVTALAVPLARPPGGGHGTLENLEEALGPWVKFAVLPLFAFANAGVSLAGMTFYHLITPIPLGIALGLFIGKPVGIFAFSRAAIAMGLAQKPDGSTWPQLFGVAWLGGIGFTMSLFIGMLAFVDAERAAEIRIGVILGSLASAVAGYLFLKAATKPRAPVEQRTARA